MLIEVTKPFHIGALGKLHRLGDVYDEEDGQAKYLIDNGLATALKQNISPKDEPEPVVKQEKPKPKASPTKSKTTRRTASK